jgi:hypothetical protein
LRLPPEIRNQIYEYALGGTDLRFHSERSASKTSLEVQRPTRAGGRFKREDRLAHPFGLLKVSHQLYAETKALPFHLNIISGSLEDLVPTFTYHLSSHPQRGAIRAVHARVIFWGPQEGVVVDLLLRALRQLDGLERVQMLCFFNDSRIREFESGLAEDMERNVEDGTGLRGVDVEVLSLEDWFFPVLKK